MAKDTRAIVQTMAVESFDDGEGDVLSGSLIAGTGIGKTKCAIDLLKKLKKFLSRSPKVLWVTPTVKLRDYDTPAEFKKWEYSQKDVSFICYKSLTKLKEQQYDIAVFDEAHHITETNLQVIFNNQIDRIIALTATYPEDEVKAEILSAIAPVQFSYSLEEGISDQIVKKVNIHFCSVPLNDKKTLEVKTKKHHFFVSEKKKYEFLCKQVDKFKYLYFNDQTPQKEKLWMSKIGIRSNFLYSLQSKVDYTKKLLQTFPENERILIFGKRIETIKKLGVPTYHSKSDATDLNKFINKECSKLAVVDSLNEGANIPDLSTCIIMNLDSRKKNLVQRIGRAVRRSGTDEANIYILVSQGTQDEVWFANAIKAFPTTNIFHHQLT